MNDGFRSNSQFISKIEMADRMQVTTRTIDSWMAKNLVPFRKIGRTVRFDWAEVCAQLKARSQPVVPIPAEHARTGVAGLLRQRAVEIRKAEAKGRGSQ
jgi:excisionase family DNA binding protein